MRKGKKIPAVLRNITDSIIQPGVKMNEKDYLNCGVTPLMVAVKHKHVEAVRKMVKYKEVDLDPLDSDGHSLEFLVWRVENSKNAEILYIIEQAKAGREAATEAAGAGGGLLEWLGFRSLASNIDGDGTSVIKRVVCVIRLFSSMFL